ncbi:MAG: hypothetical protein LBV78_24285 [Kitasatospora sp.]|nr:hypothetical protein [Kitasatospora sp.]
MSSSSQTPSPIRADILAGLQAAAESTIGDLTPENLVDAYRAEVLREAAAMARSLRKYGPAVGTRWAAQVSENVGLLAASAALEAAADETSTARPSLPRRTRLAERASRETDPGRRAAWRMVAADRPARRQIADLDVPLRTLAALAILLEAGDHSHSPSDQIAYRLDEHLVTHPDVVTTTADPDWDHRIAQMVEQNREWEIAATFNAAHPIGTPVTAYPGARPEDITNAPSLTTRTRSKATVRCGYAVVWVEGHGAWISLTHIDVRGEAS